MRVANCYKFEYFMLLSQTIANNLKCILYIKQRNLLKLEGKINESLDKIKMKVNYNL